VDQGGTTVIEFKDRVVLFELGVNVATAKAVIAHARTLAPGKPVTHLVATHNHFDHTAGLRQAVAEGLTIVQRRGSESQFREMVAHLAPDFPDDLARSPTRRRRWICTGSRTTATWRTCWWATSPPNGCSWKATS
jgi:glyoxylase-like metal-dependent hydrolase (beta-lactamase superfamily II)